MPEIGEEMASSKMDVEFGTVMLNNYRNIRVVYKKECFFVIKS